MTIAFLKGHAMKRGTLMVLKRLFVMTLGALGLGALAAGPATAQQVPAPDLFDDQVACSSNVPAGAANGPLATTLAEVVLDGDPIVADAEGVPDALSPVAGLNYIIPAGNNNCGGGDATYSQEDVTAAEMGGGMAGFEVGDLKTTVSGAIATDVATGYTETLAAYLAVRVEDAAVKAANNALNVLLTDALEDGLQTAAISAARVTLAAAQVKQTAAHGALYSVGAGPINALGIAEWRAKFAVEDAVTAWNTAVSKLKTAEADLDPLDYAKYVPLRNTAEIDALIDDTTGAVNLAAVRKYVDAVGNNNAVQDPTTGVIMNGPGAEDSGNFDAAGNLLVPLSLQDHDNDGSGADGTPNVLLPTPVSMTYMEVNTRLKSVDATVKALTKFKTDNKNVFLTPIIDAAIRRAEAEQAYYQGQFNAMVTDTTDMRTVAQKDETSQDYIAAPITFQSKYASFATDRTARDNAGVILETAFEAREAATSAVAAAFTNPQAFYQQLVDRREHLKSQDEAEVTRLAGLTGEDAATDAETTAAATAVTTAQTALDTATEAQAAFQGLVAEGSPVADLVNELLKGETVGDDGGALVDAIVGAYDTPAYNAARLDALLTEEITTIPELDADGNAVTDADGIPQRTEDVTESGRIPDIEARIEELFGAGDDMEGEDQTTGLITGLRSDIDALAAEDDPDTADVDESGRVTVLENDINGEDGLDSRIVQNEDDIADLGGEDNPDTDANETGRVTGNEVQIRYINNQLADVLGTKDDDPETADVDESQQPGLIASGDADTLAAADVAAKAGDVETLAAADVAADEGDAETLAAAGVAADEGDAETLAAAGVAADEGDAETLAAAGVAADEGDAETLAAAGVAADEGDAETLAAAGVAADEGDAETLAAAGVAADEGDAETLAAAGVAADEGDAETLAAAGVAADEGDAETLAAAGVAADAGDAETLAAAGVAADEGDAETLAAAGVAADEGDAETLAAAGVAADEGDAAEAAMRHEADMMLAGAIDDEVADREAAVTAEETIRHDADMMLAGGISANTDAIAAEMTARDMADVALGRTDRHGGGGQNGG